MGRRKDLQLLTFKLDDDPLRIFVCVRLAALPAHVILPAGQVCQQAIGQGILPAMLGAVRG